MPVIVGVKVPLTPVTVCTLSVEVAVAGFGVNVAVEPAGRPPTERVTDPVKAPIGVMVTV